MLSRRKSCYDRPSLEMEGDIVRKRGDARLLAVEAEKTRLAREIGDECKLFYVPRVVRFDEQAGVLEMKRLRGLRSLYELAVEGDGGVFDLLERAGEALAVIHERLQLPDSMKVDLGPAWMEDSEGVFLHGDYTGQNVAFDADGDRLVVLDWSSAPLLGGKPTFGSRYFDVVWFAYYVFYAMPAKCIGRWNARRMVRRFAAGYAGRCKEALSARKLRHFARVMSGYQRNLVWNQASGRPWPKNVGYLLGQFWIFLRWWAFLARPGLAAGRTDNRQECATRRRVQS